MLLFFGFDDDLECLNRCGIDNVVNDKEFLYNN